MSKKTKRIVAASKNGENGKGMRSPAEKTFVSSRVMTDADFNPDYSSVKKDLKQIGILAISFFVILIVLAFII